MHQDRQGWVSFRENPSRANAIHTRHGEVEDHEMKGLPAGEIKNFFAGGGLGDLPLPTLFEDAPKGGAHMRIVVGNQDANRHRAPEVELLESYVGCTTISLRNRKTPICRAIDDEEICFNAAKALRWKAVSVAWACIFNVFVRTRAVPDGTGSKFFSFPGASEPVTKPVPSADADSIHFTSTLPALPCRALTGRRSAAGGSWAPMSTCFSRNYSPVQVCILIGGREELLQEWPGGRFYGQSGSTVVTGGGRREISDAEICDGDGKLIPPKAASVLSFRARRTTAEGAILPWLARPHFHKQGSEQRDFL